jgi:hypothetical protein
MQRGDAGPRDTFFPLFEALNWAATIAVETSPPIQNDLLQGIRFARNRVPHDWGMALRRSEWLNPSPLGITNRRGGSRLAGPVTLFSWTWVRVDELPEPQREDPVGEAAYVRCLAEKPAEETLQALRPVLENEVTRRA